MDGVMHPSVEQAIGRDRIRNALKRYENNPADEHDRGIVRAVNADGSYEVLLDGDVQTARCAPYANAMVGDRVIVVTTKDGENVLLGRLGGEIGGGGSSEDNSWYVNPADYVVEWGKDETWTWVKYASGIAECWGGYSDWFNVSTAWSGFYYGTFDSIEYPFEFTNAPYEWVTFRANSNAIYVSPETNSTTRTHNGYLYCPSSTPSINGWIYFHAKGFWKDSPASGGTESIAPTIAERFEGIESDILDMRTNKVLWSGGSYMSASSTATLNEAVSAQPNGIVLIWSRYSGGNVNSHFSSFFIPKQYVAMHPATMFQCGVVSPNFHMGKLVYISDTYITGSGYNDISNTNDFTWNGANYVLRYVIGV